MSLNVPDVHSYKTKNYEILEKYKNKKKFTENSLYSKAKRLVN